MRRALQRQWRLPLASIALLLALGQHPGLAATIPVGGACTLVDAITAANTDTATGGCVAGSGADMIVLPAGSTQTLTEVNNDTYGPTGLPVITSAITIAGNGGTIARDSEAPDFRILAVSHTGELTLQETTVSGGVVPFGRGGVVRYRSGGGIANYGGILTVTNSTISGNATAQVCGDYPRCFGGSGGGVLNSSGTVTVLNSTITGNGGHGGGGIANHGGTVTVRNSTIAGNDGSGQYGGSGGSGGVANYGGTVTVLNSTITGNVGYGGGGIANHSGTVTVRNSTIASNGAHHGGGVLNSSGTLTMLNSTIAGNAAVYGGGVFNDDGTLTVLNSTITGNVAGYSGGGVSNRSFFDDAGILTLARTLVAGNTAPVGPEINNVPGATVLADNRNLFGVDGTAGVEGFSPGATDVVPPAGVLLPAILDPTLANNGGPTQTHALVPGSPAVDAGGPVCTDATGAPLTTDQRGAPPCRWRWRWDARV